MKRLSTFVASVGILIIILAASSLIEEIPIACLTGLMFVVVVKTFYWKTFLLVKRLTKFEMLIILIVTVLTVVFDLALAVIVGVLLSSVFYTWDRGFEMKVKTILKNDRNNNKVKEYIFKGDLMFSSIKSFSKRFRMKLDPDYVVLNCKYMRILDYTGID